MTRTLASGTDLWTRIDPPSDGAWNMAVDDAMAFAVCRDGTPRLRIYRWRQPTLSLGYFQTIEQRQAHPESLACDLVRRVSGGGAIVHDDEITYSLAIPLEPGERRTVDLYRLAHQVWIEVLAKHGAPCDFAESENLAAPERNRTFLCFERVSPGDLVARGSKVVGSAQRRVAGAILQHGSVLVRGSPNAPQFPGLSDLFSTALLDWRPIAEGFCEELSARLRLCLRLNPPMFVDAGDAELRERFHRSPSWHARTRI